MDTAAAAAVVAVMVAYPAAEEPEMELVLDAADSTSPVAAADAPVPVAASSSMTAAGPLTVELPSAGVRLQYRVA